MVNSNNTKTSYSILANPIVSQVAYSVNIIDQQNRTLNEVVAEHLRVTQSNLSNFHILDNLSKSIGTEENAIHQRAYTFTGGSGEICKKCMEIDFLSMMDDKLYLLSYYGDVEKIGEFVPTIQDMVNSTEIYRTQTYQSHLANFELQYPSDWNNLFTIGNETASITAFQPAAEKNMPPFLGGVTMAVLVNQSQDLPISESSNRTAIFSNIQPANQPQTIMLAGNEAHVLNYTYSTKSGKEISELDIIIKKDGKLYTIVYSGALSEYSNYFETFMQIIHSLRVGELEGSVKDQNLSSINSDFSTYENSTHRIKFNYPNNWSLSEEFLPGNPISRRVSFVSPGELLIINLHLDMRGQTGNLTDFVNDRERSLSEIYPGYKRINFTETSILNKDAYLLTFQFPLNETDIKAREYGIMDYKDKLIIF